MNETQSAPGGQALEGRMFLYERPELLNRAEHANLGLSPVERPYEFVRNVRAAPLVWVELASAQKDYPIVFSETEIPQPLAMLGIIDDTNLFVDESGNWERRCYIPYYIRCHPIGFAKGPNDQVAIVIDRAARSVSDHPEEPFFAGDGLSEPMQRRVDLCARYSLEREKTRAFCTRLKELGLFTGQQVKHHTGGDERSLGTYAAVDVEKLGKLDSETLRSLHAEGWLSAIYAHVFSLENWNRLLGRRTQRGLANAPSPGAA